MSYRARRPHDCDGHVPFTFRTDAARQAKNMRRYGIPVDVFACPFCGKWHIGGTSGRKPGRPTPRAVQIGYGGLG